MNNFPNLTLRSLSASEVFCRLLSNLKPALENTDATETKMHFKKHIDSKRTFSKIKSVFDLIEVLVQLDVICEEYVDILKRLVQVSAPDQLSQIECYEKLHTDSKHCIVCRLPLDTDAIPIPEPGKAIELTPTAPSVIEETDDDTPELNRAFRYVSSKLGGERWVDLARKLNVKEYEINNIKADYPHSSTERAYQMLVKWTEESYPNAKMEKLLSALERGVNIRRDIVDDIKNGRHKKF